MVRLLFSNASFSGREYVTPTLKYAQCVGRKSLSQHEEYKENHS